MSQKSPRWQDKLSNGSEMGIMRKRWVSPLNDRNKQLTRALLTNWKFCLYEKMKTNKTESREVEIISGEFREV